VETDRGDDPLCRKCDEDLFDMTPGERATGVVGLEYDRRTGKMKRTRWTTGPIKLPGERLTDDFDYILQTPMESLRFGDFAALKSGRDRFSKLRLPALREMVPDNSFTSGTKAFDNDKQLAACLRWVLRGLPVEKAIRKVKTDEEVTRNAIGSRQGE